MKEIMKIYSAVSVLIFALVSTSELSAQAFLNANGPGSTFEEITAAFAAGSDTSAVEDPQCIHAGRHITEVWDAVLGRYVYQFVMHVASDNDRCINFDRQRVEVKTYEPSPNSLKGVTGETILYKWRFRVPVGFKPSSSFTHIHQIKAVGGNDDDPLITLTVRKGSPNKMELIHNNTTKVSIVNLSLFEGNWVECTEAIFVDSLHGTYSMTIKKVSDGTTVLTYSSNDLMTIRSDNTFIRPKWGIYRSLNSPADLRDDTLLFSHFYIAENAATALPNAPSAFAVSVGSSTQINLAWTDNSSNEEQFRIERSTNGTTWTLLAAADPNSVAYTDIVASTATPYYYRMRSENTFGTSSYSSIASSVVGEIISVASGNWSSASTWIGGAVPTSSDNVTVESGHTVVLDAPSLVCKDLTVKGTLNFINDGTAGGLTAGGNVTVNAGGIFKSPQLSAAILYTTAPTVHSISIAGNLSNNGTLDLRDGSNGTSGNTNQFARICNVTFTGASNSTISLSQTSYSNTTEEFNGITINKTGNAKVILSAGNLFMSNNSSVAGAVLTFTNGMIETGSNEWVHLSTSSGGVSGAGATKYVNGILGRGFNTSAGVTRTFEVGDANGYRPIKLTSTAAVTSGGYAAVSVIPGNANNGSSILNGGITTVSSVRYEKITYRQGSGSTASLSLNKFEPSYGADDGVTAGNTNLRVAYSTDNRATWTGIGQTTPHQTSLTSPPTTITPDALGSPVAVNSGSAMFITLGSTSDGNPLSVEISSMSASSARHTAVLRWTTESESSNAGFEIERKVTALFGENRSDAGIGHDWERIAFVAGAGTTDRKQEYLYIDRSVLPGRYQYRLKQIDTDGGWKYLLFSEVSVDAVPSAVMLYQNYPNPFNPSTVIPYALPASGSVRLTVFNSIGQELEVLVDGMKEAGTYSAEFNASRYPSGIYFYTLRTRNYSSIKKMILTK